MYNAGDRKAIRQAEKSARLAEAQRREVVGGILSVAPGRQWVHDLLAACHIFDTPFAGVDPQTNFNCGQQNVGLRIFADVMQHPDSYLLMMKEANERAITDDSRQRRDHEDSDGGDHPASAEDGTGDETGTEDRRD